MPFCTNCGAQTHPTARFCRECGTAISPSPTSTAQPPVNPSEVKGAGGSSLKKLVIIGGSVLVSLVLIAIFLEALSNNPSINAAIATTCDKLSSSIIDLSEDNQNPFSSKMLKLYDIQEVNSTDYVLECKAEAKWARGEDSPIKFYVEEDDDGDRFIGYESQ